MFKKILFLVLIVLPSFVLGLTVDVYHTSDTHGFYFPRSAGKGVQKGGFALLAGYLDKQEDPYLLLDSGDFTSGTYEAKKTGGNLSVQFMNALNYDAATIGNHENDFKKDNLLKNMQSATFDILAANMYDSNSGTLFKGVRPYAIYRIKGKRIGVIGLAKEFSTRADGIKISNDKASLKKALKELKEQNPDAIILLTHSSVNDDKHKDVQSNFNLVKGLEGINVVLGGHAHKIFENVYNDEGVLFVESGTALTQLSKITLNFDDKTGKFEGAVSELVELTDDKYTPDPEITVFADNNRDKEMDKVIGKSAAFIPHYAPKDGSYIDAPLSNLIADLIKQYAATDIGMQNTGGTRENIYSGDITNRTVYQIFPFSNTVCKVQVTGKFIKNMLYRSLRENKSLFEFSGLEVKYKYEHDRPQLVSVKINGRDLEPYRTYSLATNDYIAKGGSEGFMFKKIKRECSSKTLAELFTDYVKSNPEGIKSPANGRIIKVN